MDTAQRILFWDNKVVHINCAISHNNSNDNNSDNNNNGAINNKDEKCSDM
ncbi:unnamed protein product [Trichobilharzia regenti]|nr:unnamed protein product [Trichobilharzia regenti]